MLFLSFMCVFLLLLTGTLRYVVGGIMELMHPELGVKRDYSLQPTVSLLIPCFNEGPAVYGTIESISVTTYPKDKLSVIVVDDCSNDDSWGWIQKAVRDFPYVVAVRNEVNKGKTKCVLRALEESNAEFVVIVDSDTLIAPNAIQELMSCFADPKMGSVGAPAGLRNPNVNALTAFQTQLYYLASRVGKRPEASVRTVGCIGGYLLATRRAIFEEIRPIVEARNWFGVKVKDGEDRFITHNILLRGYETYINMNAHCWTNVPDTFNKFFGQQLRWYRSAIRDFFWTIRTLLKHVRLLHPVGLYAYVMIPLMVFVSVIKVLEAGLEDPLFWMEPNRVFLYIAMAFIVTGIVNHFHKEQQIRNPLRLLVYGVWWVVNTLYLMPYAAFTLDADAWGNRDASLLKIHSEVRHRV